jgi:hypothetical protein
MTDKLTHIPYVEVEPLRLTRQAQAVWESCHGR